MTGVVIRCPNCGTTQATLGECEACHEAETRYYCPNHTPGRWLDSPACGDCGARVGVAPRAPTPPRASETRARPTPRAPRTPAPPPRREPDIVWSGPVRTPDDPIELDPFGGDDPRDSSPFDPSLVPVAMKVAGAFGCLRRLVILVIILAMLALFAFWSLFGVGGLLYGAGPGANALCSDAHQLCGEHSTEMRITAA